MWDVGLAKMFRERDTKSRIGPCIGKVVSNDPLKVTILNGAITLDKEHLYICNSLLGTYKREFELEGEIETEYISAGSITFIDTLKKDDEVLLIPSENEQVFFIIDKISKVGD